MFEAEERRALEDEGARFALAVAGIAADPCVVRTYAAAHQHLPLLPSGEFDHLLLEMASQGPWALRAADGYARFFAPASALRRKLAVLVAILESVAPADDVVAAREETRAGVAVQLLLAGAGFVLLLGVGMLALGPLHLAALRRRDGA